MPEKYLRRDGLPLLLRHTGATTLPERPPERGEGPRVVCLHDAGLQSSIFEDLLRALEELGLGGIAVDLPGHGRSGGLDALPSIEEMAELARWACEWCGPDRPLLLGHGMGALVALDWARREPDGIAGLVLCGTGEALAAAPEAIERMRQVTRGRAPRPFDPKRLCADSGPDLMRRAWGEGLRTDPRATLGDLEASRRWVEAFTAEPSGRDGAGGEGSSQTLGVPACIVVGEAESEADRERAERLAVRLGGLPVERIAGAAHLAPLEQPAALARVVQGLAPGIAEAS